MWHVYWQKPAINKLHDILQEQPHLRNKLTSALREFTQSVQRYPAQIGESRYGGLRVETIKDLTIYFLPIINGAIVQVVDVHLVQTRPKE